MWFWLISWTAVPERRPGSGYIFSESSGSTTWTRAYGWTSPMRTWWYTAWQYGKPAEPRRTGSGQRRSSAADGHSHLLFHFLFTNPNFHLFHFSPNQNTRNIGVYYRTFHPQYCIYCEMYNFVTAPVNIWQNYAYKGAILNAGRLLLHFRRMCYYWDSVYSGIQYFKGLVVSSYWRGRALWAIRSNVKGGGGEGEVVLPVEETVQERMGAFQKSKLHGWSARQGVSHPQESQRFAARSSHASQSRSRHEFHAL